MKCKQIYYGGLVQLADNPKAPPEISLEFTSPSNPSEENNILKATDMLKYFDTAFSCVNFGGGTISPERVMMMINKLKHHYSMPIIGYLRRSHIDRDNFNAIAETYSASQINTIFLTEGRRLDIPTVTINHYNSLLESVIALKKISNFKIAIEARPESDNSEVELINNLIDIGIDEIITRFSFNTHNTLRFLDKLNIKKNAIKVRIGIIPFESPSKTFLTAHRLNVQIPEFIHKLFSNYPDNQTINLGLGIHILLLQSQHFIQAGYDSFHIRFERSYEPIEAFCRYYGIHYTQSSQNVIQSIKPLVSNIHI